MAENQHENYSAALQFVIYEGETYWNTCSTFLWAHAIFMGFLLQNPAPLTPETRVGPFVAGLLGLGLCILWLAALTRIGAYYGFRIALTKEIEPQGWRVLRGISEEFAEGKTVTVGRNTHKMPWLAMKLRSRFAGQMMAYLFLLVYIAIIVLNCPGWGHPSVNN